MRISSVTIEEKTSRLVGIIIVQNISTFPYVNSMENKFEFCLDWHKTRPLKGRNWMPHYTLDDKIYAF